MTLRLGLLLALAASGATSCSDDPPAPVTFPAGFLIGASTAGFQVEMGCPTLPASECADTNSDWYAFMTSQQTIARDGTFLSGEDPAIVGPGEWELYEDDFDLAQQDGHSVFRMSIEWSRIFPNPTFGVTGYEALRAIANQDAIDHYHAVFAALRARGIEPYVTVNHYTLPTWIHDGVGCSMDFESCTERGWVDASTVPEIAKYAGFLGQEFGGDVDLWATENEPFAVILPGYIMPTETRTNPPALSLKADLARTVFVALIEAHARMYDALHEADQVDADGDGSAASVGIVYAMAPVAPADPNNERDVEAAKNVFYLWNLAFMNAVANGVLDDDLDGTGEPRADLAGRLDHIGINYYVRITVVGATGPVLPALSPLTTFNPFQIRQDETYPRGLYEMLMQLEQRYDRPIYVTENDGQSIPGGDVEAEKAALVETLQWVGRAIEDGVDVRGYMYWSLMDNVEWNHGTSLPFGLYAVDPTDPSKRRVPRETATLFARIASEHRIASDLVARYPIRP